ncbi:polygalacturonase-like protein [Tanacetum coccineum]
MMRIYGTLVAPSDYNGIATSGDWIRFHRVSHVTISGGTLDAQAKMFHILIDACTNVKLQGVRISASDVSPNINEIRLISSTGVTIVSTKIATGDDCISIGPGNSNLWIEKVTCGPVHSISTEASSCHLTAPAKDNTSIIDKENHCSTADATSSLTDLTQDTTPYSDKKKASMVTDQGSNTILQAN